MDINNKLKENIKEEMLLLPKETQEVLNSFEFKKIFFGISTDHKLSQEETETLEVETILVLIGLVDNRLFTQNIEINIGISEEKAKKISQEVGKKIFAPICERVVEKIKNNMKEKEQSWEHSINFILSGGDYSIFLEK